MTATDTIRITAASRLHFGMLAPGPGSGRRFGGAGVMVASPDLVLKLIPAGEFACSGPASDRVRAFAETWNTARGREKLPGCELVVEQLPPMHSGFGVGTQLGLTVARALNEFFGSSENQPDQLAASVGRGQRSAVGSYGFCFGGLIAEEGKRPGEILAPLETRVALPDAWRWLLVQPRGANGLHGRSERQAFSTLDDASEEHRELLAVELREHLIPAARRGDFPSFSDSLFRFGYQAGLCFKPIQGGAYNGPQLERTVSIVRSLGICGVGQSSWGPTVFGLCPDELAAQEIARKLHERLFDADISITSTANEGARISVDQERISP